MIRHALPEDARPGDDTAWFGRYSPFIQSETRRQIAWKRRHWPELPDGEHVKNPGHFYPHLLPTSRADLNLFPAVRDQVLHYIKDERIERHIEAPNLRSSQVSCFNFLFPLRINLDAARTVLAPLLPGLSHVQAIEFEVTGGPAATRHLGEPPGGKRGANATSIDATIEWLDKQSRLRLTLLEWKYTEEGYGGCGGYASKGNPDRGLCERLDATSTRSAAINCYLASGGSVRLKRRYWDLVRPEWIAALAGIAGCPFRGPLYQLLRQELLADWLRSSGRYDLVDVAAVHFKDNYALQATPSHLAGLGDSVGAVWRAAVPGGLREVEVERLVAAWDASPRESLPGWREYLRDRYGL